MNISFTAVNTDFEYDEYALIVSIEGIENSLSFQRASEQESDDDSGLYIQFGEQQNGDYECVTRCCVSRKNIEVVLSRQLGNLENVDGFHVNLDIDDESYDRLIEGLSRVFRDMPSCLQIN
jgi:hypothetical protein